MRKMAAVATETQQNPEIGFSSNENEVPSFDSSQRRHWNDFTAYYSSTLCGWWTTRPRKMMKPEEPVVELLKPVVALPELPSGFHDLYSGIHI